MKLERVSHVIQILSGLVLIVGLWLVVLELRQTRELTQTQLLSDSFDAMRSLNIGKMGEDFPEAMERVCEGQRLSVRHAVALAERYQASLALAGRSLQMRRLGFDDGFWDGNVRGSLGVVLASEHGRAWWLGVRSSYETFAPELVAAADALLATTPEPYNGCHASVQAILAVEAPAP